MYTVDNSLFNYPIKMQH